MSCIVLRKQRLLFIFVHQLAEVQVPGLFYSSGKEKYIAKEKISLKEIHCSDDGGGILFGAEHETLQSRRITESADREDMCKIKRKPSFSLSDFCQQLGAAPLPYWKISQYLLNCFIFFQQFILLEGVYLSWHIINQCIF